MSERSWLVIGAALLVAGCTGNTSRPSSVANPTAAPASATPRNPSAPAGGSPSPAVSGADGRTRTVLVYLSTEANCGDVRAVERQIPDTEAVATATLNELFAGRLTEGERAAGLTGFGPATDGLLRRLRIEGGIAYVDLNASHRGAIDSAGTSCGGSAFQAMVGRTLGQFPTVKSVRYAFDGDPRAFIEFSQGGCPDDPIPAGDPCDPRPWA